MSLSCNGFHGSKHADDIETMVTARQEEEGNRIEATVIRFQSNLHPMS